MKRFICGVAAVVALMFVLVGCKGDPIKADIISYSKSAIPLANKYGVEFPKKMEEAQKNPKDYATIMTKDVLPMFKEYREKMAAIKPATKELQDIHNAFVANLTEIEGGLALLVKAVQTADQKLAKEAGDKLSAAAPGEEKFKKDLEDLAKKHDVKFK